MVQNHAYRALTDKNIRALSLHEQQFVYLDNEALLSNAWAGKLFIPHQMPEARIVAGGEDFTFLISDGKHMQLIRTSAVLWEDYFPKYAEDYWYPDYARSISWHHAEDPEWDWRGSSSSDQMVGQVFALTLLAEYMDEEDIKQRAIVLLDQLMTHLLDHDLGKAPVDADSWSKMLSAGWNHSDDEMYFLAYWSLYPYALNDSLKVQFKAAIRDHWEAERPEKDGLWNLSYAMTGAETFDLEETVWYLQEFPLDMIQWNIRNSHRKDMDFITENFRGQTTREVLPPDERPELKHNRNLFNLDKTGNGNSELSGGDTFLLPYWMGRFLGVISAPVNETI